MSDEEPQEEVWTFGGSRVSSDGKRVHAWIDPNGVPLLYAAKGTYAIGSLYKVKVLRKGERTTRYGEPQYTGERTSEEFREGLWAEHKAAEATLALKAKERADKRDDPIEDAIDKLAYLISTVPVSQRTNLRAYVISRLMKASK
ncbi:hypothetical protein AB0C33_02000 [Nonomuraea sp. NPDC048881]|uniref:hypothetical protein n=1 Tax=Nonomuraea sp. NPDC048881 TaxID=3155030 RepID=UPI0033D52550